MVQTLYPHQRINAAAIFIMVTVATKLYQNIALEPDHVCHLKFG